MKRILVITSFLLLMIIPTSLTAMTKEDLLNYVNSKSISNDQETYSFLQKYSLQFTRMITPKDLTEEEILKIYNYLEEANDIVEKYNVTKKSETYKIPEEKKSQIKDILYECVLIITNAKSISNDEKTESVITINDDDTIDIVFNGSIVDKINLTDEKFNYVGLNRLYIYIIIISFLLFIVFISLYIKNRKKRIVNDLLFSLCVFSLIIGSVLIMFSPKIDKVISLTKLFKKVDNYEVNKKVLVNDNHEIIDYPNFYTTYGTLKIPKLNIEEDVTFGDNNEILSNSIGHNTSSYLPGEGKTIIYSAHNYNVNRLKDIALKDKIVITTDYGEFTYIVDNIKIMDEKDYSKISFDYKKETLVFYTCYPFNISLYGNKRFVVFASLKDEKWVN